ncbi:GNAT family N-acetyltransferase [Subtercola frigoramans]|uniref:Aminoglycoside 3-N-acetyltransferase I n=1 Tax=Subtercola frigoramans TaxID=120298 RepID=A0ABS2L588_9MICO|nr:GNAT family N-acetyltransferase [Subtercola frigoramans]MBM7471631.1 aminoglycoside 3-N-acetyltransferase I [Subtercola frigoramans]
MSDVEVTRLVRGDEARAARTFAMMAAVFEEPSDPLEDSYLNNLLRSDSFWAIAAFLGSDVIGGLTAHTVPLTRTAQSEVFVYDLAVHHEHRRQGIAARLLHELRVTAALEGIYDIFVVADNDDVGALDFYRTQEGTGTPVTMFSFTEPRAS